MTRIFPIRCCSTPFQCSTGENITPTLVCDGTKNCADGSDEMMKACKGKYPTYCIMPQPAPKFLNTSCNDKITTSEGDLFRKFTLVSSPSEANVSRVSLQLVCIKGKWISLYDAEQLIVGILRQCEGLPNTSGVKALYYQNGNRVDVDNAHYTGTVIYPVCDSQAGNAYPNVKEATCGENGKWSVNSLECSFPKKCEGLPNSSGVKALYYQNGIRVDANNVHYAGTVIYPVCESVNGSTYPNVKEATCGKDGKWSVNSLECVHCNWRAGAYYIPRPLIEITSSHRTVICWVHFVSPYLIMTDASCFNERPTSDYYVDAAFNAIFNYSEYTNSLVSRDRSEFIKIENIYYFANSREENLNHPALAKVKDRLTLNTEQTYACLDWSEISGKVLAYTQLYFFAPLARPADEILHSNLNYPKACRDCSNFPTYRSSQNEICFELYKDQETKKGAGIYHFDSNRNERYYLRGIAKDSFWTPTPTIIVTDLWKYLGWIKSNIAATNLDYPNINTPIPQATEIHQQNGVLSFNDFEWSCYNGNTKVKFVNGCHLPEDQYVDFQIDTSSTKYKAYGEIATNTKFDVPEHSVLRNIKCKDEYTSNFTNTQSSVCFQGTWLPQIPQC